MGAPKWPPYPQRSGRPGEAVAPLDYARSVPSAPSGVAIDAPGAERRAARRRGLGEHGERLGEEAVEGGIIARDRRPAPRASDAGRTVGVRLEAEHTEGADGAALAGVRRLDGLRPRVEPAGVRGKRRRLRHADHDFGEPTRLTLEPQHHVEVTADHAAVRAIGHL